jgi:membrane protein required for colicin V production
VLKSYFPQLPASVAQIISFTVIFIVINIALRLIANVITKTLKFAMLGWLNRLFGATFGLIKSAIILGIAVFLINLIPFSEIFMEKAGKNESFFYPILEMIGPELYKQVGDANPEELLK